MQNYKKLLDKTFNIVGVGSSSSGFKVSKKLASQSIGLLSFEYKNQTFL